MHIVCKNKKHINKRTISINDNNEMKLTESPKSKSFFLTYDLKQFQKIMH